MNYNTKFIVNKFNISKPTINAWIKKGIISEPERDWRGWRIWNEKNIKEISSVIMEKQNQYIVGSGKEDEE